MNKTICYFGDYDSTYGRTKVMIYGLRESGATVVECRVDPKDSYKYFKLYKKYHELGVSPDVVIIGFSDTRFMPFFARLILRGPIIVWDPLFSFYDNWVFDRQLVREHSIKALYHWTIDWLSCRVVDRIILDLFEHINFFVQEFHLSSKKFIRSFISADTQIFFPRQKKTDQENKFCVEYHGKYIPVQGVDVIVRAAKLLEYDLTIKFVLIGGGQTYNKVRKLVHELGVSNIEFLPNLPVEELPRYIAQADVCMGLIGDIPRVDRAIPNKLYEAAAMARISINADAAGIKEVFTDGQDVVLIKRGSPEDLAAKIVFLKNNPEERLRLANNAYQTFMARCT
ncbi:MAG: glycosyltransferase, partial [Candidatus Magasanikbacteria bacterium]|nr:glycosyltransferase [Candidatus Magasanikbacteria bacterium]